MSERVYFLLGSNVGTREIQLAAACASLQALAAGGRLQCSDVYETAAWGLEDQAPFLNMAVALDTLLSPEEILDAIRRIETQMGRQRSIVWGPRTLDVDVLIFGARNIRTPELHVPHPRLPERRFALAPLAEIAGGLPHPESGISISELLASCPDTLAVRRLGPLAALAPKATSYVR